MNLTILIIIAAILSGIGKAIRDNVAFRFNLSVFSKIKHKPTRKWFESDGRNKPDHPIAPLWDAWHAGDFLSYAAWAIILAHILSPIIAILALSIMLILFTVLYHYTLMADPKDRDLRDKLLQVKRFWNYLLNKAYKNNVNSKR